MVRRTTRRVLDHGCAPHGSRGGDATEPRSERASQRSLSGPPKKCHQSTAVADGPHVPELGGTARSIVSTKRKKPKGFILDDRDVSLEANRYLGPDRETPLMEKLRKSLEKDGIDAKTGERQRGPKSSRAWFRRAHNAAKRTRR